MAFNSNINNKANSSPQSSMQEAADKNASGLPNSGDGGVPPSIKKDFFWNADFDSLKWNKSFPYQLVILEKIGSSYAIKNGWKYTLPFAPESLNISTPFANNLNFTLGGVIEEHSGTPLKIIEFSGTTGYLPLKGTTIKSQSLTQNGTVQAIFGGTLNAASALISTAANLTAGQKPNLIDDNSDVSVLSSSGYMQIKFLQSFLERYAAIKKTIFGRPLRLAFAIWKDDTTYLVTPSSFNIRRSASSPMEYMYSVSLKAWKRVQIAVSHPSAYENQAQLTINSPSKLSQLLNKLQDARLTLMQASSTILAVRADADRLLFEPLRQSILFVKDLMGIGISCLDLPISILQECKKPLLAILTVEQTATLFDNRIDTIQTTAKEVSNLANQINKPDTQNGDVDISSALAVYNSSIVNETFNNPFNNADFFDSIKIGSLNLSPVTINNIFNERQKLKTLTRLDFEKYRDQINGVLADFTDSVGLGSNTYNITYNRSVVNSNKKATQQDYDIIFNLNNIIINISKLAVSTSTNAIQPNSMDFFAGMASRSGIAFTVPRSKIAVPFIYGSTLEQLSLRYLGDATRWMEIAALNGLQSPYVDEIGFDIPLLTNGNGNQVIVGDASNLFIGQSVYLSSNTTSRNQRRILSIDTVVPNQVIVNLDGDADLAKYTLAGKASLHASLPNTVNSQMTLFIPSDQEPADPDLGTKAIPGVNTFDPLYEVAGVDLLLTSDNDLAITPDGDCRLAYGLNNIIQIARTRLGTVKGSLILHPDIGLPVKVGQNVADFDIKDLLKSINSLFTDDPAFSSVSGITINNSGPVLSMGLTISIVGTNQNVPISFEFPA